MKHFYIFSILLSIITTNTSALPPCPTITATINSDTAYCQGSITNDIHLFAQGGTAPYTFTLKINNNSQLQVTSDINGNAYIPPSSDIPGQFIYYLDSAKDANNCVTDPLIRDSIYIIINEIPQAQFSISPTQAEIGDPISITNSSLYAGSYNWDFGDDTTSYSNDPVQHIYSDTGAYVIMLTVRNGNCQNSTSTVVFIGVPNPALSIEENNSEESTIQASPNPFSNELNIQSTSSGILIISAASGTEVSKRNISAGTTKINTENFEDGVYILCLINESGTYTRKVIKQ